MVRRFVGRKVRRKGLGGKEMIEKGVCGIVREDCVLIRKKVIEIRVVLKEKVRCSKCGNTWDENRKLLGEIELELKDTKELWDL